MFDDKEIFIAPKKDEIEISVFGPGYGECILIHIGYNEWIIIDSCVIPTKKEPVALEYLRYIGVSLENVKLILATHWHDDHIKGLSKVVKECKDAEFVLSEALRNKEFLALLGYFGSNLMTKVSSGVEELYDILCFLKDKNKTPKRAIADRLLMNKNDSVLNHNYKIISLSPSDFSILQSNYNMLDLLPKIGNEKTRVPSIEPNYTSVVLWVEINNTKFLLGSDLQDFNDQRCGWEAILKSTTRPKGKAIFFKVPHHGSANGDHPEIWDKMISDEAVVVVTPFHHGQHRLPNDSDIQRLCKYRDECYITASTKLSKKIKTERTVDKIIEKTSGIKSRKLSHYGFGQVRLKTSLLEPIEWHIETLLNAKKVCS